MISNVLFGRECYAGWGYNAKTGNFISDGEMYYSSGSIPSNVNSSTHDFDPETQKHHDKLVERLLGNCRDFLEEVFVENQNAYNLIEFLMENCGTNGFFSHVTIGKRRSCKMNV
uniref:PPPDE domain-containing protein n=1 Tax=Panagrolaimus sp. JU765 TaxID=591449 RepID=A0AC34RQ79_9BILA